MEFVDGEVSSAGTDPMVGRTVSHYEVQARVGRGGMGVVYKAIDLRLRRSVALKFVSASLTDNKTALKRFVREAKAASALDHSNICTIYDIDQTDDGRLFIAMAYVEGESLAAKISRGPLALDEALTYVVQAGKGLARAHAKGITHRDVKPANIVVGVDGTVKLLDFGLATLTGESRLTGQHSVVGTVAYMSPEQLIGDHVDHRTDIWSLGVVLYEMLAGKKPFAGEYASAVSYAIVHSEPKRLRTIRPDLPSGIERVVTRMLSKDADRRYPDIDQLLEEVESTTLRRQAPDRKKKVSILVLPFDDMSPARDARYFSEGVAEELISSLAEIHALRIICRTSAWQIKESGKDVGTIRRELDVDYLLDGGVRKMGNHIRVTTQLIDAESQSAVFATKHDGKLDDIFAIQETVARSVVDTLKLRLSPSENERITNREFDNVYAYDCYLRAREEISRYTVDSLERALGLLQEGLDVIGENVLLYGGLGYAHWTFANLSVDRDEHLARARELADKVHAIAPNHPQGARLKGLIAMLIGDQRVAIEELKTAAALDPRDTESIVFLVILMGCVGKTGEARPLASSIVKIDPLNPISHGVRGWLDYLDGDFEKALEAYRKMCEMAPDHPSYLFYLALGLASTGRVEEAFAEIDRVVSLMPDHPFAGMFSCFKYALDGNADQARSVVTPAVREMCESDVMFAWFMADCFAIIGDKQSSIDWLEKAVKLGFINHRFLSNTDPFLENLRGEEGFETLMKVAKSRMTPS